jgi:hypothetical protein
MNQSLMDPKLIVLAGRGDSGHRGWLGCISENAELAAQRYGSGLGRSTGGRCERTGRNAEWKRNWRIVRSGS